MRSHLVFALLVAGCSFNETTKPDPTKSPTGKLPGPVLNSEAISADTAVPPLTGGTLLISKVFASQTGTRTYASNPDLGKVDVVVWTKTQTQTQPTGSLLWTADVGGVGAEPGRIAEDPQGLVYVVLRQKGQVATLDVDNRP